MRVAEVGDAVALVALINAAFAVERAIFDGDRIDLKGLRAFWEKGTFLVAEQDGGLIGCVYGELRGATGYVGLLSVAPARQGIGLGRRLMEAVEGYFREKGCTLAELRVVSAREGLPAFYRHLGYVESRTEPLPADAMAKVVCHFQYMTKAIA